MTMKRMLLLSLVAGLALAGCMTDPNDDEGPGGGSGNDGDEVGPVGNQSGELPDESTRETPEETAPTGY